MTVFFHCCFHPEKSALTLLLSRMLCKSSFSSPERFCLSPIHWNNCRITIYFHRFSTSNSLQTYPLDLPHLDIKPFGGAKRIQADLPCELSAFGSHSHLLSDLKALQQDQSLHPAKINGWNLFEYNSERRGTSSKP